MGVFASRDWRCLLGGEAVPWVGPLAASGAGSVGAVERHRARKARKGNRGGSAPLGVETAIPLARLSTWGRTDALTEPDLLAAGCLWRGERGAGRRGCSPRSIPLEWVSPRPTRPTASVRAEMARIKYSAKKSRIFSGLTTPRARGYVAAW